MAAAATGQGATSVAGNGTARPLVLTRKINAGANSAQTKVPNTYQLEPSKEFAFATHREAIREIISTCLEEALNASEADPKDVLMNTLAKIKSDLLQLQAVLFPRHRVVVHGIIGNIGHNQPSLIYGSQCLASPECGDDGVSVSVKNYDRFLCVCAFGSYQS
ncbi:unnamed protein product [Mesocestoides corti]|uniref:Dynein light chain n=1 Tax=Mesocestoides corti TaxID=53468 RepID=A0A0R3U241_MESCO|nr:unnamed protein product [Mesocestoides corti]